MDEIVPRTPLFSRGRMRAAALATTALASVLAPSAGVAAALTGPAPAQVGAQVHATAALSSSPIVGLAPSGTAGYWMASAAGGVFSFGDARFHGSTGGVALLQPIVGMASTATGRGYWLVASDGGIFNFGDAGYHGSAVTFNARTGAHSVGVIPVGSGYWVPN